VYCVESFYSVLHRIGILQVRLSSSAIGISFQKNCDRSILSKKKSAIGMAIRMYPEKVKD